MTILKGTIRQVSSGLEGDRLISTEIFYVKKCPFNRPVLLTEFGIGYEPGDVFDWCSLKDQSRVISSDCAGNIRKDISFEEVDRSGEYSLIWEKE